MRRAFLLCWIEAAPHPDRIARPFPDADSEGKTVKRIVLAAALGVLFNGAVQAAAIELDNSHASMRVADLSTLQGKEVVAPPPASMSELPEPEVLAMMLVGLVLIGYRASRHSSEKFK